MSDSTKEYCIILDRINGRLRFNYDFMTSNNPEHVLPRKVKVDEEILNSMEELMELHQKINHLEIKVQE